MNVQTAYENLGKLIEQGHGEKELIYSDGRSGDTGGVYIYSTLSTKDESDTMGRLCEEEDGYEYVPVHTDH